VVRGGERRKAKGERRKEPISERDGWGRRARDSREHKYNLSAMLAIKVSYKGESSKNSGLFNFLTSYLTW
jgi:hypothetical protein